MEEVKTLADRIARNGPPLPEDKGVGHYLHGIVHQGGSHEGI